MLRLLFLGSSDFAVPVLKTLAGAGEMVVEAVVTRPDSRAGRGRKPSCTPVALAAAGLGLRVIKPAKPTPENLGNPAVDAMVSAAYGCWLPGALLRSSPLGVVNIHPSLLPEFRGAAPVARTILAGKTVTGVSFMVTDTGWDTGPLLRSVRTRVLPGETAGELSARLALIAAEHVTEVLRDYSQGRLEPVPQAGEGTYAGRISREDARLDWTRSARELERAVRAFNPSPGAWTLFMGKVLKVSRARRVDGSGTPGTFTRCGDRLLAATAEGMLELLEVQPESGRVMDAGSFLRGVREIPGS